MVNQVEKKNPKRRFKEFWGKKNWNVYTLGTVLMSMYNGQTPSRSKGEYWNGKINWLTSGELNCGIVNDTFEKITDSGLDSANLKIIPKGILVIAITGLEASGTRGNCAILGCNTTLNQSCMALFPIRSLISSDFLFNWYLFIGDYYGIKYTQGTKQQSYNSKILNDLEIVIPSLDEQNKISSFFSNLDSMIDFQKRKLNKLEATRKALLQEMFPEEGQDKPKRRFKGFTDAWEQRKVNEIFKVTRGQVLAASLTTPEKNRGNIYPVYSSQTKDNGLLGYYSEYLFENAITWTTDGANAGTVNFRPGRFYSTNVNGVLINENGYACYAVSEIINKVAYKYVSKVGNPKLMNNVMAEINIMITPDIDELKQISKLIEAYNQYITLHQRKLDKLKNLKQAYLNEMFV
jgi:Restriction endonuclease S subunits